MAYRIHHNGMMHEVSDAASLDEACAWIFARDGAWNHTTRIETITPTPTPTKEVSTWQRQVSDEAARKRNQATQDAVNATGLLTIDPSRQLYATGTRLADIGYSTQAKRAAEHAAKVPLRDAAGALRDIIAAERRREVIMTGAEIAHEVTVNGRLKVSGYALTEHALRGLLSRAGSPAWSYVAGLRDRIADGTSNDKARDKERIAETIVREMEQAQDTEFQFRMRDGLGDCFAVVSPSYGIADFPLIADDVLATFPSDAKGTWSYDPESTAWSLRASVYTPTPSDEQAVGEPFEGFGSVRGADGGNSPLSFGGGILVLACLNASVYEAEMATTRRVHRRKVRVGIVYAMRDISRMIQTLTNAWGIGRETIVPMPDGAIPFGVALPGLMRGMLTERRGELVGILPGKREDNILTLAATFADERRNPRQLVKADFGQAFTRHIQTLDPTPRRRAEAAIGAWMVNPRAIPSYVEA